MPGDINGLRKYYANLEFSQKKDFIVNLKKKLEGMNSVPHSRLLEECVREYNEEVRKRNKAAGFAPKPKMPDISPDAFARALATMFHSAGENPSDPAIKSRLIGKWQRDPDEGDFYYKFNADDTFETNEFEGASDTNRVLHGNYTVGPNNAVLMEPHDKLKFTGLMFSQTGESLIINLKDGLTFEYTRM